MPTDAKWSDYWKNDSNGSEVFVTADGKKSQRLSEFWQAQFTPNDEFCFAVDIASGAGSVFSTLNHLSIKCKVAVDISFHAFNPNDKSSLFVQGDASRLPFANNSVDLLLSQFGIEYAESDTQQAFSEAGRVLKPGGNLKAICHIAGSTIETQKRRELDGLTLIDKHQFLHHATQVAVALHNQDVEGIKKITPLFQTIEQDIHQYCQMNPDGMHNHIYRGVRSLLSDWRAYSLDDTKQWLKDINTQKQLLTERLKFIVNAALHSEDIERITLVLDKQNCRIKASSAIKLGSNSLPVGYFIDVIKNQ